MDLNTARIERELSKRVVWNGKNVSRKERLERITPVGFYEIVRVSRKDYIAWVRDNRLSDPDKARLLKRYISEGGKVRTVKRYAEEEHFCHSLNKTEEKVLREWYPNVSKTVEVLLYDKTSIVSDKEEFIESHYFLD